MFLRSHLESIAVATLLLSACAGSKAKNEPSPEKTSPPAASSPSKVEEKAKSSTKGESTAVEDKVLCAHGKEERTLEVRAKDQGCELIYTKGGQEAVVATSHSGKAHCAEMQNKIKGKLTASGFTCK